jgi:hypothetical protein
MTKRRRSKTTVQDQPETQERRGERGGHDSSTVINQKEYGPEKSNIKATAKQSKKLQARIVPQETV